MSSPAKRAKVDPVWTYAATHALKAFASSIIDYGPGGTVRRLCLEEARYNARIFAELGHLSHDWKALDRKYQVATQGRHMLSITNTDEQTVEWEGVRVQGEYQPRLKAQADRYRRQFEAHQVKDVPDQHLDPRNWVADQYQHAEAWMTFHEDDYFDRERCINKVYLAWPWAQPEALPVFERLLVRYGVPYMCDAWPTVRVQAPYWALVVKHQSTFDRRHLESCMRVRTVEDLRDYAPFWSTPEDYLLHILHRDDDPTAELVQAWCQTSNIKLDHDTLRAIFTTTRREIRGTMIALLMKFGYLPTVEATEEDPWHYFGHYLRCWGIRK